ncbi:hypothetical protein LZQ00_10210 [Sphingobacterium sp. SRCM116780]|uniref:hypothetical protein n=1 Tax=Sphingobacterium sp. SRCM116780 TaxID=2907623 RepID=UPI001F2026FF|nr:hypothetical protein [Sphingobacterium sp. SRCM116780]UIR54648.1 hypothetical protein LZQ00_10210 [Sphingobacterium sp. SRCM116780]
MRNKIKAKYTLYFIAVLAVSLLINLGSAIDDPFPRLIKPLFKWMCLGTSLLLVMYILWINFMNHLRYSNVWYCKQKKDLKMTIFLLVTIIPICSIHLFMLSLLLGQRSTTVFTWLYFKGDFWFFIVPVCVYVILVYLKPDKALLWLYDPKMLMDKNRKLYELWLEKRNIFVLRSYLYAIHPNEYLVFELNIPLWKAVLFEKTEICTFAVFANGEKWMIKDEHILINPWVVKIGRSVYANMLYFEQEVGAKDILQMDRDAKNRIVSIMAAHKLDMLLLLTRRMKANFKSFWEIDHLLQMDENRLYDTFQIFGARQN